MLAVGSFMHFRLFGMPFVSEREYLPYLRLSAAHYLMITDRCLCVTRKVTLGGLLANYAALDLRHHDDGGGEQQHRARGGGRRENRSARPPVSSRRSSRLARHGGDKTPPPWNTQGGGVAIGGSFTSAASGIVFARDDAPSPEPSR